MKVIGIIALIITLIGALNWGLIAVFDINLVTKVFPSKENAAETTVTTAEEAPPSTVEVTTEVGEESSEKTGELEMTPHQKIAYIVIGICPIIFLLTLPCCCRKKKCSSAPAEG